MKPTIFLIGRLLAATLVLTILYAVSGPIFGLSAYEGSLLRALLANLLIILVLAYTVLCSRRTGLKLAAVIFLVFFGVYTFNTHIEAVFFQLDIKSAEIAGMFISGSLVAVIFSLFITILFGRWRGHEMETPVLPHPSPWSWLWRVMAGAVLYVFFYIMAGALVFPFVQDFYAQAAVPDMGRIVLFQLGRGLVYVLIALPVMRMMTVKPCRTAVLVGLLLAVLGGVAPLIPDNPYMPGHIRLAHAVEIGLSNFLYGLALGFLFRKTYLPQKERDLPAEQNRRDDSLEGAV